MPNLSAIRHQIAVIVLILLCLETKAATYCYKCATAPQNPREPLCSDFDYSEKFIIECPFSTLCMKKFHTANISGSINATERDCAHQKYETQILKNRTWHKEDRVEEPYTEGCNPLNDKGARTSTTLECYCRGYLCNNSMKLTQWGPISVILLSLLHSIINK